MGNNKAHSLWPDFNFTEVKTPLSILQEQANEFSKKTKNVLIGEIIATEAVNEKTGEPALVYQFYIKAPLLSNYRYLLFRLEQKINLYPVEIYFLPEKRKFKNIKEDDFENTLKDIFNNPQTISTIQSLYAQSHQMASAEDI